MLPDLCGGAGLCHVRFGDGDALGADELAVGVHHLGRDALGAKVERIVTADDGEGVGVYDLIGVNLRRGGRANQRVAQRHIR